MLLTVLGNQGFDEFMNLVIDEAVEVKLVSKVNPEEKRRRLGIAIRDSTLYIWICVMPPTDKHTFFQAKFSSRATMSP